METLRAAYDMAKANNGAPGVDGVRFEAIEAQGVDALLAQLRDELTGRTYQPLPARRHEIPRIAEADRRIRRGPDRCGQPRDWTTAHQLSNCWSQHRSLLGTWAQPAADAKAS